MRRAGGEQLQPRDGKGGCMFDIFCASRMELVGDGRMKPATLEGAVCC